MRRIIASFLLVLICATALPFSVFSATTDEQRAQLEAELKKIEEEIKLQEAELARQRKQTGSLKKDLGVLTGEIQKKKLEIQKKNQLLKNLSGEITERVLTISELNNELGREKKSLAKIIRKQNELEQVSVSGYLLSGDTVSEFYADADAFTYLKGALTSSFARIRRIQDKTQTEKVQLEDKKKQEDQIRLLLEKDKKQVEVKHGQQQQLVGKSQNVEKVYEATITQKREKAAAIKARLFSLIEVTGGGIAFGEALRLAKEAGALTGVRPAFILAILQQETRIGQNVGQCYLTDPKTGAGMSVRGTRFTNVMKPTRDVQPFMHILEKLGKEYETTRVSCPIGGYGYGGAMGPSQFIPSTWMIFDAKITSLTGQTANPWVPLHAFTATALYVAQLGATAQTYNAERNAACRYYSGRMCGVKGVNNSFYGNSVMAHAAGFEDDIDTIADAE